MKVLAIILSMYFLALNVMPCSDTGNISDDSQTASVVDFDGAHDDDCELCSPFCHCHCCHAHTIHFSITKFDPLQAVIPQGNFTHFDNIGEDITFPLFQPPKV